MSPKAKVKAKRNAGRKSSDAYRLISLCGFPKGGKVNDGCRLPVVTCDAVACGNHGPILREKFPAYLERIMVGIKQEYGPFPTMTETMDIEVENILLVVWDKYMRIIRCDPQHAMEKRNIVECYLYIINMAESLEVDLLESEKAARIELIAKLTQMQQGDAERQQYATEMADAFAELKAAEKLEQKELKRKADAIRKRTDAAKLVNDIDDITSLMTSSCKMDEPTTPPSAPLPISPPNKIGAYNPAAASTSSTAFEHAKLLSQHQKERTIKMLYHERSAEEMEKAIKRREDIISLLTEDYERNRQQ